MSEKTEESKNESKNESMEDSMLLFTRSERQLLSIIKMLHRAKVIKSKDIHNMATDYLMLTISMNGKKSVKELFKLASERGGVITDELLGLEEKDKLWFMTLSTVADPEESVKAMGYKNVDDLINSLKDTR